MNRERQDIMEKEIDRLKQRLVNRQNSIDFLEKRVQGLLATNAQIESDMQLRVAAVTNMAQHNNNNMQQQHATTTCISVVEVQRNKSG